MVVGAKVCDLTDGFLWCVCGLYVGLLTSPLRIIFINFNFEHQLHSSYFESIQQVTTRRKYAYA